MILIIQILKVDLTSLHSPENIISSERPFLHGNFKTNRVIRIPGNLHKILLIVLRAGRAQLIIVGTRPRPLLRIHLSNGLEF